MPTHINIKSVLPVIHEMKKSIKDGYAVAEAFLGLSLPLYVAKAF